MFSKEHLGIHIKYKGVFLREVILSLALGSLGTQHTSNHMVSMYGPRKVALKGDKISSARENLCSLGEEIKFYQRGWNFSVRESSLGRFIPKKNFLGECFP